MRILTSCTSGTTQSNVFFIDVMDSMGCVPALSEVLFPVTGDGKIEDDFVAVLPDYCVTDFRNESGILVKLL